jgi:hypothetical protein
MSSLIVASGEISPSSASAISAAGVAFRSPSLTISLLPMMVSASSGFSAASEFEETSVAEASAAAIAGSGGQASGVGAAAGASLVLEEADSSETESGDVCSALVADDGWALLSNSGDI